MKKPPFSDGLTKWAGVIMADAAAPSSSRPDTSEDPVKEALHAFVEEASKDAQGKGQQIADHRRRSPGMNPECDGQFTQLNSFADAQHHIGALSEVRQATVWMKQIFWCCGSYTHTLLPPLPWSSMRIVLSLSGRVFVVSCPALQWRDVGITILQSFTSALGRIAIADDVAVCLRTLEDMQGTVGQDELGWQGP
jgi:hypothetical protein